MPRYFGIDPGGSGGIACIEEDGSLAVIPMPATESYLWEVVSQCIGVSDFAVIEEVSGYMPKGKKIAKDGSQYQEGVAPGSTMFTFGQSYGALRMALTACGLVECESWFTVRPQAWQKWLREYLRDLPSGHPAYGTTLLPRDTRGGESSSRWKGRLKSVAESLFPGYYDRITLKTADAILLALYCKGTYSKMSTGRTLWG
jgi:hypothetical protein